MAVDSKFSSSGLSVGSSSVSSQKLAIASIFEHLWNDYIAFNPQAKLVYDLILERERQRDSALQSLVNDHSYSHHNGSTEGKACILELCETQNVELIVVHEFVIAAVRQAHQDVEEHSSLEQSHFELVLHNVVVVT